MLCPYPMSIWSIIIIYLTVLLLHVLQKKYRYTETQARYKQSNDRNLIHRHRGNYYINCVLLFALFTNILLVHTPVIVCINILKRICFYKYVHWKVPYCHKNTTCISRFNSISSKEGIKPTPLLLYWILKELWTMLDKKVAVDQNQ